MNDQYAKPRIPDPYRKREKLCRYQAAKRSGDDQAALAVLPPLQQI